MMQTRFLVLEDESVVARALAHIIGTYGEVVRIGTAREADALLADSARWSALFLDVGLPDGSGLDVLARARRVHDSIPAMVLTGRAEADAINAAHDLGAHYVVKPVDQARIVRFVVDACKPQAARDGLDAIVARYVLSPAESDILRAQE